MKTLQNLILITIAATPLSLADVPSTINYQGRLTDSLGNPQSGARSMALRIYDAPQNGTKIYDETIGQVPVDANGVYSFQFGASGLSDVTVTEALAATDGTSLSYQGNLTNPPALSGTLRITDGTYSWNEVDGNPGALAAATATVVSGFVVGAEVTHGGSGYTDPPTVTITGNGTGATATATVSNGSVSEITITSAGTGYTTGATITIAPPPSPFLVDYDAGSVTITYASPPAAGQTITATYRHSAPGISGALAAGPDQWIELVIDNLAQEPRQKVLAVPFASYSNYANQAVGQLAKQVNQLSADMALALSGLNSPNSFGESFSQSKANVILAETQLTNLNTSFAAIFDTSTSGYAYIGAGAPGPLAQNFENVYVRGAYIRNHASYSYSMIFTFTYFDNSTHVINGTMTGTNQYVPNPHPEKMIKRIDYSIPSNVLCYLTVRQNTAGNLTLSIPASVELKSKLGLFLDAELASEGDLLSASLIGSNSSQTIKINDYTEIDPLIGSLLKIQINLNPSKVNNENFTNIRGYSVRFSD